MKIASFETADEQSFGILEGDRIRVADPSLRRRFPDLRALLAGDALAELPGGCSQHTVAAADVRFLPTIPRPDKLICVGVNYRPHMEEMGRDEPRHPLLFVRFPGSQVGHDQPLVGPAVSEQYDFEGELAVVIGQPAHRLHRDDAHAVIAGYTCFMDGSVRDWQRHSTQMTAGKNFARSGAMGPCLATADELPPEAEMTLATRLNGELMQRGRLDELIFPVAELIEYISAFTELLPGDVIATGTPGGVGAARTPPVWLTDGDRIEVEIPGIGVLANTVRAN